MSFTLSGQKSRILLNKYHCRSSERPGGIMCSGSMVGVGLHVENFNRFIFGSLSSQAFFTNTTPGCSLVNLKWCICEVPFSAV